MSPGTYFSLLYFGMILVYLAGIALVLYFIFRILKFIKRKEEQDARVLRLLEDVARKIEDKLWP